MAKKKVADLLVEVLAEAGIRRIYGVPGDSLNGITETIRRKNQIQWVHVRHEETAAFAAGAEAHLTGRLAVCSADIGGITVHPAQGLMTLTVIFRPRTERHRAIDSLQMRRSNTR
jgi:pyruvate dehydrogenase (quinone)